MMSTNLRALLQVPTTPSPFSNLNCFYAHQTPTLLPPLIMAGPTTIPTRDLGLAFQDGMAPSGPTFQLQVNPLLLSLAPKILSMVQATPLPLLKSATAHSPTHPQKNLALIASKEALPLKPPSLTLKPISTTLTGKPLAAQLVGPTGAIVATLGVKVPSGAMATIISYHPTAPAGGRTTIGGNSSAQPAVSTLVAPPPSCVMVLFALSIKPSTQLHGLRWVHATVAKLFNSPNFLGDITMLRFLLSLEMLGLIFLSGCGSDNKPIDQDKLQQEFNDLQKARQKEDPYAGKRK